jgi:hypothetical protein
MKFQIKRKRDSPLNYSQESGLVTYTLPEIDKTALIEFRKQLIGSGYKCWCGRKMKLSDYDSQWQAVYQAVIHSPFPPALHFRYICPDCFEQYKQLGMKLQDKKQAVKFKFKLRRK